MPDSFRSFRQKYLISLGLDPRRVQVHREHAYVLFGDQSALAAAVLRVSGQTWKGSVLRAKRSASRPRTEDARPTRPKICGAESVGSSMAGEDWAKLIREATEPLVMMTYEEQLKHKQHESYKLLKKLSWEIKKVSDLTFPPNGTAVVYL